MPKKPPKGYIYKGTYRGATSAKDREPDAKVNPYYQRPENVPGGDPNEIAEYPFISGERYKREKPFRILRPFANRGAKIMTGVKLSPEAKRLNLLMGYEGLSEKQKQAIGLEYDLKKLRELEALRGEQAPVRNPVYNRPDLLEAAIGESGVPEPGLMPAGKYDPNIALQHPELMFSEENPASIVENIAIMKQEDEARRKLAQTVTEHETMSPLRLGEKESELAMAEPYNEREQARRAAATTYGNIRRFPTPTLQPTAEDLAAAEEFRNAEIAHVAALTKQAERDRFQNIGGVVLKDGKLHGRVKEGGKIAGGYDPVTKKPIPESFVPPEWIEDVGSIHDAPSATRYGPGGGRVMPGRSSGGAAVTPPMAAPSITPQYASGQTNEFVKTSQDGNKVVTTSTGGPPTTQGEWTGVLPAAGRHLAQFPTMPKTRGHIADVGSDLGTWANNVRKWVISAPGEEYKSARTNPLKSGLKAAGNLTTEAIAQPAIGAVQEYLSSKEGESNLNEMQNRMQRKSKMQKGAFFQPPMASPEGLAPYRLTLEDHRVREQEYVDALRNRAFSPGYQGPEGMPQSMEHITGPPANPNFIYPPKTGPIYSPENLEPETIQQYLRRKRRNLIR